MTSRTLLSAIGCGLLVGLCLNQRLEANSPSAHEPHQDQADTQDVEALQRAAGDGDASAQYYDLGLMHNTGRGVPQDEAEATRWLRWLRLAAAQGIAAAQDNLGVMYADGRGVLQDEEAAVRWFRLAANQGAGYRQDWCGRDG